MLYNYQCSSHGIFEANRALANRKEPAKCPECERDSDYIVSAPRIKLPGWDTSWPTASSKWERMHEEGAKKKPE